MDIEVEDIYSQKQILLEIQKYSPTLDIENFGLSEPDLQIVFNAGDIMGIGPSSLETIIHHLKRIYCDSIGIEYVYSKSRKSQLDSKSVECE